MLVHNFLENSAARLGEKIALVCDGQRWTYNEINQAADQLAAYLLAIGIKPQDRVVIFLENSAEAVISIFGIMKAGAVFVCLNPTMKPPKLSYILKDSGARAAVSHINKASIFAEAAQDAFELDHIVWCQKDKSSTKFLPPSLPNHIKTSAPWGQVFTGQGFAHGLKLPYTIDVDLATIIYTSGSTGEPKGVVSAHYNVTAATRSITTYLKNHENDIILNALPLSFDYGLYQVLMAFLFGGTIVMEKSFFYPYKVMERIAEEGVTGFPIVPTMVALLLQMEDLSKFNCNSLRYFTNTGAALPATYIQKLQGLFPSVDVYSMYGLTECKRVSYMPPEYLPQKPTSVGIPMPNTDAFIVTPEGIEVGPNEVGELVVRGSNVMQGYWNCPEETAKTFRPGKHKGETHLYTGDLFKKDEDGFLYFVARKDDLIKTKGERVSPKELENALCAMEGIIEAAAIGVPDEIYGKAIKVFIVRDKRLDVTKDQVLSYCKKNLEPFMVPKYIEFKDSLPKSNSGKINKKELS